MAVTSLWRIKGGVKRVLLYAMNEDKTIITDEIQVENGQDTLSSVLSYASRDSATTKKLVSGFPNLDQASYEEMMKTKIKFFKTGGVTAYHGYQSFAQGEVTPEIAHEIGCKLAERLWAEKYQVLVCTHVDKESHTHNHFVINTVSYVDGKKFYRSKSDYRQMQQVSDELCREYGLSIIQNPSGRRKNYAEYYKEKDGGLTMSEIIRNDIDECIKTSPSMKLFYHEMQQRGYSFDFSRKYVTVTHKNFSKPRRLKTLGEDYDIENIKKRVSENWYPQWIKNEHQDDPEDVFFRGDYSRPFENYQVRFVAYISGLRHVKANPNSNRRLQRLIGEELAELDRLIEEQELIVDNNIECYEDIVSHKEKCLSQIDELIKQRDDFRRQLRNARYAGDEKKISELKDTVSSLTSQISKLRNDVKICQRGIDYGDRFEESMKALGEVVEEKNKVKKREHVK